MDIWWLLVMFESVCMLNYAPVGKSPLIQSSGALWTHRIHAGRHEVFYDASVPFGHLAALRCVVVYPSPPEKARELRAADLV